MAFIKISNESKIIILLVLFGISLVSTTNIDCNGKSYHCVNSTHFMICVDLGAGVSTTVDDFVIPCPPPTECKITNRFECEFQVATTTAPVLRTSDVTNELEISATTVPWENIAVTTSFATSDLELSDLKNNNESLITFPEVSSSVTTVVPSNANVDTTSTETVKNVLTTTTEPLFYEAKVTQILPKNTPNNKPKESQTTEARVTELLPHNKLNFTYSQNDITGTKISDNSLPLTTESINIDGKVTEVFLDIENNFTVTNVESTHESITDKTMVANTTDNALETTTKFIYNENKYTTEVLQGKSMNFTDTSNMNVSVNNKLEKNTTESTFITEKELTYTEAIVTTESEYGGANLPLITDNKPITNTIAYIQISTTELIPSDTDVTVSEVLPENELNANDSAKNNKTYTYKLENTFASTTESIYIEPTTYLFSENPSTTENIISNETITITTENTLPDVIEDLTINTSIDTNTQTVSITNNDPGTITYVNNNLTPTTESIYKDSAGTGITPEKLHWLNTANTNVSKNVSDTNIIDAVPPTTNSTHARTNATEVLAESTSHLTASIEVNKRIKNEMPTTAVENTFTLITKTIPTDNEPATKSTINNVIPITESIFKGAIVTEISSEKLPNSTNTNPNTAMNVLTKYTAMPKINLIQANDKSSELLLENKLNLNESTANKRITSDESLVYATEKTFNITTETINTKGIVNEDLPINTNNANANTIVSERVTDALPDSNINSRSNITLMTAENTVKFSSEASWTKFSSEDTINFTETPYTNLNVTDPVIITTENILASTVKSTLTENKANLTGITKNDAGNNTTDSTFSVHTIEITTIESEYNTQIPIVNQSGISISATEEISSPTTLIVNNVFPTTIHNLPPLLNESSKTIDTTQNGVATTKATFVYGLATTMDTTVTVNQNTATVGNISETAKTKLPFNKVVTEPTTEAEIQTTSVISPSVSGTTSTITKDFLNKVVAQDLNLTTINSLHSIKVTTDNTSTTTGDNETYGIVDVSSRPEYDINFDSHSTDPLKETSSINPEVVSSSGYISKNKITSNTTGTSTTVFNQNFNNTDSGTPNNNLPIFENVTTSYTTAENDFQQSSAKKYATQGNAINSNFSKEILYGNWDEANRTVLETTNNMTTAPVNIVHTDLVGSSTQIIVTNETQTTTNITQPIVTITEVAYNNEISITNRSLPTNTLDKTIKPIELEENITLDLSTLKISNSSFNVILTQKGQNATSYPELTTAMDKNTSESTPPEGKNHNSAIYTDNSIPDHKINTSDKTVQVIKTQNDTADFNFTFILDKQNHEERILKKSTPFTETIVITQISTVKETNTSPTPLQYVENTNLTGKENDSMGSEQTKILTSQSDTTSSPNGSSLTDNTSIKLSYHSTDNKIEQMVTSTTFKSIETSSLNPANNSNTQNDTENNFMRFTTIANTLEKPMVTETIPLNPFLNVLFNMSTLLEKTDAPITLHVENSYIPEQFTTTESNIPDVRGTSNNPSVQNIPNTLTVHAMKEDNKNSTTTTSDGLSENFAKRSTQNILTNLPNANNVTVQPENKIDNEDFDTSTQILFYESTTSLTISSQNVTQLATGKTTSGTNSDLTHTENILLYDTVAQTFAIKSVTKSTSDFKNNTPHVVTTPTTTLPHTNDATFDNFTNKPSGIGQTTVSSKAEDSSGIQNITQYETPSILTQNADNNINRNTENVYINTDIPTARNKTVKENQDNQLTSTINKTEIRSPRNVTISFVSNTNYTEDLAPFTTITHQNGMFPDISSTKNSLINGIQSTTRNEASNKVVSSKNKIGQENGHVTVTDSILDEVKSSVSIDDLHHLVEINHGGSHITSSGLNILSSSIHNIDITSNVQGATDATITLTPIKDVTVAQTEYTDAFAKDSTLRTIQSPATIVGSQNSIKTKHELNEELFKSVTQDHSVHSDNLLTSVIKTTLNPLEAVETVEVPKSSGSDITNTNKYITGFTETSKSFVSGAITLPKTDESLDQVDSPTKLTISTPSTLSTKFTVQQTSTISRSNTNVMNSIGNTETNTESLQSNFKVNFGVTKSDNSKLNEAKATNINNEFTIQNVSTSITTGKIIINYPTVTKPTMPITLATESSTLRNTKNAVDPVHTNGTNTSITSNFDCKFRPRGKYGDNNDCRKFYICIGRPQPINGLCPVDTVFSEFRTQCTKNLSHCIRENQFHCMAEGRFTDYLTNNIYYICVKNQLHFTRFKFQCQRGYHLDKKSVKCLQDIETSTQPLSSKTKPVSSNGFICKKEGKFPDLGVKSNIYYMCVKNKQNAYVRFKFQCQKGYHLNRTTVRCLQDIIEPMNHSVSSKDSASKDESVTIKKKEFECTEPGKFADPEDCRKYYKCSLKKETDFVQKKKKCDSDEVFNKDKKKCVDSESYEC